MTRIPSGLPSPRCGRHGAAVALVLAALSTFPALADGGVTYTDIADGDGAGITYRRTPSDRFAVRQAIIDAGPIPFADFSTVAANHPLKASGAPGVALLDFDLDGDLDIYATNGPGTPNSLYSNQLVETGSVSFVDVGLSSGAGATDQDSSGVCYGDVDNDGDPDLFVLGSGDPYRLFENQGDGTFLDVSAASGPAFDGHWAVACSMGDVDGDGRLDIVVANTYTDWSNRIPVVTPAVAPNLEHNELFLNQGGNVFVEAGEASGLHEVSNMPDAAFSWAIALVDYDADGDVDVLSADNQGPPPTNQSEERGYNRLYQNDGTGHFTDISFAAELDHEGGWMGLTFADFNCDGHLDFFATNLGNYLGGANGGSSLFQANGDGTFTRRHLVDFGATPFGWGTSALDYDNDGDSDLVWHGGVDNIRSVVADNPGVIYRNDGVCSGVFTYDSGAILKNHNTRTVNGVAVGDLNNDGFEDVVTVANFDIVPVNFFPWVPFLGPPRHPELDQTARFEIVFFPLIPGHFVWLDPGLPNGTLSVELNSADNGNGWVAFDTVGGKDLVTGGQVNRDGIGALVRFTPDGGPTSTRPVAGGSSYASEDNLTVGFGLGQTAGGVVEVQWPGGARNRLDDVVAGERLVLPEIPCSFDGDWGNFGLYDACVMQALNGYLQAGVIDAQMRNRLRDSAWRAYHATH